MREALLFAVLTLIGWGLLGAAAGRLPSSFRLAAALPVALAGYAAISAVQLALRVPFSPLRTVATLAAAAACALLRCRRDLRGRRGWSLVAAVCAVVAATSLVLQALDLTKLSFDSYDQIAMGSFLEQGRALDDVPVAKLYSWPVFVPLVQAMAPAIGVEYLSSASGLSVLTGLACYAFTCHHGLVASGLGPPWGRRLTGASTAALATTYFVVYQVFFLNGHVAFGLTYCWRSQGRGCRW